MVKKFLKHKPVAVGAWAVVTGVVVLGAFSFLTPAWDVALGEEEHIQVEMSDEEKKSSPTYDASVTHLTTPEPMYAIYMSQCVVGTKSFREKLVSMVNETALNAVVIDIKDYSGTIGFPTTDLRFETVSMVSCGAGDMRAFIKTLHEKGIYVIGRITVFQDPSYTKVHPEQAVQSISRAGEPWKDYKGLSFVDVSSEPYWDYVVTLSREAYDIGFDELNYDYIRYPSDGPMADAQYINNNKAEALEEFFKYLHEHVDPLGVVMSADLFGYVTVLTDDLGIGQVLERTLPYFDYVAPMVYPSHYNKGFAGLSNPNSDPYKVVFTSMTEAVRRAEARETNVQTLDGEALFKDVLVPATETEATTTKKVATGLYTKEVHSRLKLRPWLQDFDYGKDYTKEDIEAQIHATYDSGLTSWFFWDPANKYENVQHYLTSL